eukprot:PhF_6_TR13041/c0_g1_i1/m.20700/K04874/KCNA1; potassium voltage-gated channel Shaker-related subfamily A member 1
MQTGTCESNDVSELISSPGGSFRRALPLDYSEHPIIKPLPMPFMEIIERNKPPAELDDENSYVDPEALLEAESKKYRTFREKMYVFLEEPTSSTWAQVWALCSIMVVVFAAALMCIETLPEMYSDTPFEDSEYAFSAFFTFEILLRLYSHPSPRIRFFTDALNLLDVVVIVPFYIELILGGSRVNIRVLRIIRVMRVFRLFKLSRYVTGLQTIISVAHKSSDVVFVLSIGMLLIATVFGTAVYFAEIQNCKFDESLQLWLRPVKKVGTNVYEYTEISPLQSALDGLWWASATITTVGYGDVTPSSAQGKALGGLCMIVGVLTLAIPAAVFSSNFLTYAEGYVLQEKLDRLKKTHIFDRKLALVMKYLDDQIDMIIDEAKEGGGAGNNSVDVDLVSLYMTAKRVLLWDDDNARTLITAYDRGERDSLLLIRIRDACSAFEERSKKDRHILKSKYAKGRRKSVGLLIKIKL